MTTGRTTTAITVVFMALFASAYAMGDEIYHWLDENGVPNFSQRQPDGEIQGVSKFELSDTTPPDYDPDEDRYGVEAQAERMAALREERDKQREDARERRRNTAQQQPMQYRDPYRSYSRGIWFPPVYPRPPLRPQPPIELPYRTATLGRPGG